MWCYNKHNGISNHLHLDCLLKHLHKHRFKKTSKLCVAGLCEGNLPVTSRFPSQRASNAEDLSIWWHHHAVPAGNCFHHWILTSVFQGCKVIFLRPKLLFQLCWYPVFTTTEVSIIYIFTLNERLFLIPYPNWQNSWKLSAAYSTSISCKWYPMLNIHARFCFALFCPSFIISS